ncbi:MAG: zinc-ribbon domain-containing protein [Lachnospiraceae bacterium]|nr:zinc-ribbon domain-containing protein [Lachnospiraceae bacterium]
MKEKLYRFMQGRYGNDQLNRFLMILVLVCFVISLLGGRAFYVIGTALLVYAYFRMLSRNIYKRRNENSAYMRYEYKVRQGFYTFKRDMQQRKTHHIYRCPSCRQKIRVPRGKGKIEIRCPKCSQTFIKKS